jgi:hypothetical protein
MLWIKGVNEGTDKKNGRMGELENGRIGEWENGRGRDEGTKGRRDNDVIFSLKRHEKGVDLSPDQIFLIFIFDYSSVL